MVHNGIEYGQMQLIADTYSILQKTLGLSNDQIGDVFGQWNQGALQSYLLEISAEIMHYRDEQLDGFLVDIIKDEARSKGTGKWTSQVAMDLGIPIPTIDTAVAMRDLSRYKKLRVALEDRYPRQSEVSIDNKDEFLQHLHNSLYFGMISLYAQGLHMLYQASEDYKYNLNIKEIAAIWRAGCIIRSAFLDRITQAYAKNNSLEHLFLDDEVREIQNELTPSLPVVLQESFLKGISVPAFASVWSYYLASTTGRLSSNLIQAQRDFFGAHTYERTDMEGIFHTNWNNIPSTKTDI
jgi:6-phosphogluconate dehydrogenase